MPDSNCLWRRFFFLLKNVWIWTPALVFVLNLWILYNTVCISYNQINISFVLYLERYTIQRINVMSGNSSIYICLVQITFIFFTGGNHSLFKLIARINWNCRLFLFMGLGKFLLIVKMFTAKVLHLVYEVQGMQLEHNTTFLSFLPCIKQ